MIDFAGRLRSFSPEKRRSMTGGGMKDRAYLVVAGVIAAAILADLALDQGRIVLYLVRDLLRLVDYLTFWR